MSENVIPLRRCTNPECDPDRPCRECLQRMADEIGAALGSALDKLADGAPESTPESTPEPAGCGCVAPAGLRVVRD